MTKKQLALEIIKRLKEAYPDAGCTLDYDEAWKLLVSVRLAAQCTDARVNVIVEKLYEKFPDVDALAAAGVSEIEEIVRPCGLGKSKAKDISACMKVLKEQYGGTQKCESDHGGCVWKTGDRHRHTLYPSGEPHGTGKRYQGTEKSRDGTVEDHSTGRGE